MAVKNLLSVLLGIQVHFQFHFQSASSFNFVPSITKPQSRPHSQSPLFMSLSDWRDIMFDLPGTAEIGSGTGTSTTETSPPREVNVLPFPFQDVLLQGETKQLRLYEDRFVKLFDDTMENHCGVVAMGLLAEAGLVQKVALCEIEAYNRMGDQFGIFVTIRVVGRAELLEVKQQEPYLKAVCLEVADTVPPNLELPNIVAQTIEDSMERVAQWEQRLELAQPDDNAANKKVAPLEDRFYEETDDEEEEEDDDSDTALDRKSRYATAYRTALATDTQGYRVASPSSGTSLYGKTPQELTAISWAAFCTDSELKLNSVTYRIQALDSMDLFERLKLASHMLKQKEAELKAQLVKAGLDLDLNESDNNKDKDTDDSSDE